jgi:hypothetical protein
MSAHLASSSQLLAFTEPACAPDQYMHDGTPSLTTVQYAQRRRNIAARLALDHLADVLVRLLRLRDNAHTAHDTHTPK